MKPIMYLLVVLTAGLLIITGCSKGGSASGNNGGGSHPPPAPNDTTAPVLTINTPTANQVFTSGQVISVSGRITDDLGLFRGYIRITNDANGAVLKDQQYEIHYVLAYDFAISYLTSVSVPSDYTVTVFFEDHGYNNAVKSVKVKVNP